MAETKNFLDYAGLQKYNTKIKTLISKAGKTEDEIKTIISSVVGTLPKGASEATITEHLIAEIQKVDNKVGDISTLTDETTTTLAQALSAEIVRAKKVEQDITTKITTLIGKDANKSARDIAAEETAKIVAGADTDYDTLKEIEDWIKKHPESVSAINSQITALENKIGTIPENAKVANVIAYVDKVVVAAQTTAEAKAGEAKKAADDLAKTIGTIPEGVEQKTVIEYLKALITSNETNLNTKIENLESSIGVISDEQINTLFE